MSATVDIITNKKTDALTIPYSAVVVRSFDLDSLNRARQADTTEPESTMVSEVHAAEADDSLEIGEKKDSERKELKGVFVIRDGVARFVEIETGIADQKNIEVSSGLQKKDKVISGPYRILRTIKDGDHVEITNKDNEE